MKHEVLIGQVDYTVLVKMRDTAGAPATGLDETDIDIAYARVETDNDVTTADVTPASLAALTTAHTDWGFEEVSATDHPGLYRLDIADAVFAAGAWSAVVTVTGTGLDPADMEFVLVPNAPLTGVLLAPVTHTSAVIPTVTAVTNQVTANVTAISGDTTSADNLEAYTDGTTPMPVNATQLSGDATAADNAEAFFDGTGYAGTNNVIPTVTTLTGHTPQTGDSFARIGATGSGLTSLATQASVNTIDDFLDTEIAAILEDTGTTLDDFIDTEIAAILALLDDARAEPGQGAPPVNPDLATKIDYLYKAWRNRSTQTASEYALYADDGTTKDHEAACSDDGTTFVRGEIATGA